MSTRPVPTKLHTALPVAKVAPRLARIYREQFKIDAVKSVALFGKHASVDVRRVRHVVASLDVRRKWSPAVFLLGYELGDAVKRLDVTGCFDALAALENLSPSSIYDVPAQVSSILSEAWEPSFVRHMRAFKRDDGLGEDAQVLPVLRDELDCYRKPISAALRVIRKFDPEVFEEFDSYVTRIKVFNGANLNGETANVVFGSIWLRPHRADDDAVAYWVEHLVHEISHLQLYALSVRDPLVLNSPEERFPAPLRPDPRPLWGNFHATFVLSRMLRIFRRIARVQKPSAYAAALPVYTDQFKKGLSGLYSERAKLTPLAARIRDTLEACALES